MTVTTQFIEPRDNNHFIKQPGLAVDCAAKTWWAGDRPPAGARYSPINSADSSSLSLSSTGTVLYTL